MRAISVILVTMLLLLPISTFGEIQTVTHTVKQPFGGSQSPDDARIAAIAKAKRDALEMAGTYIESLTVVRNSQVDKDEILALAAGVLKAEVISQKNYASDDSFGIEIIVNVVVDTSVLENRVKKLMQDKTHIEQLNKAREKEKQLLEKIAVLEKENRKSGNSDQKQANLQIEFQKASQGLTAVDWSDKALALWDGQKFTDPIKALEYLNDSIKMNPDYAEAYGLRGLVYSKELGQYKQAIKDFDEAIRLKTNDARPYNNRGLVYKDLEQYQLAIKDFDEAIRLKPDLAAAYFNRGVTYGKLGQYQRAIKDYNKANSLEPDYTEVYFSRGVAYGYLGQYQRAIKDYNKAIRLKPDYAEAYSNRGVEHLSEGKKNLGCRDAQKACALGNCKLIEFAKSKGDCF